MCQGCRPFRPARTRSISHRNRPMKLWRDSSFMHSVRSSTSLLGNTKKNVKVGGPLKRPHMFQLRLSCVRVKVGGPFLSLQVDEEVAKLHLLALGAALNVTTEEPTGHTGVKVKSLSCLVPQVRLQQQTCIAALSSRRRAKSSSYIVRLRSLNTSFFPLMACSFTNQVLALLDVLRL